MERLDISQSGFGIQSDEIFGIYYIFRNDTFINITSTIKF